MPFSESYEKSNALGQDYCWGSTEYGIQQKKSPMSSMAIMTALRVLRCPQLDRRAAQHRPLSRCVNNNRVG